MLDYYKVNGSVDLKDINEYTKINKDKELYGLFAEFANVVYERGGWPEGAESVIDLFAEYRSSIFNSKDYSSFKCMDMFMDFYLSKSHRESIHPNQIGKMNHELIYARSFFLERFPYIKIEKFITDFYADWTKAYLYAKIENRSLFGFSLDGDYEGKEQDDNFSFCISTQIHPVYYSLPYRANLDDFQYVIWDNTEDMTSDAFPEIFYNKEDLINLAKIQNEKTI